MVFTRSKVNKQRTAIMKYYISEVVNNWKVLEQSKRDAKAKAEKEAYAKGEINYFTAGSFDINWEAKQYELWLRNLYFGEENETFWSDNKNNYTYEEEWDNNTHYNRLFNKLANHITIKMNSPMYKGFWDYIALH
jgi:hypothetical protein